jgi:hypothetical protein
MSRLTYQLRPLPAAARPLGLRKHHDGHMSSETSYFFLETVDPRDSKRPGTTAIVYYLLILVHYLCLARDKQHTAAAAAAGAAAAAAR